MDGPRFVLEPVLGLIAEIKNCPPHEQRALPALGEKTTSLPACLRQNFAHLESHPEERNLASGYHRALVRKRAVLPAENLHRVCF